MSFVIVLVNSWCHFILKINVENHIPELTSEQHLQDYVILLQNVLMDMEFVQQLRKEGNSTYESLMRGGRTRLRPIWMTALATVLALTPLALSQEGGALIASDLAITVIGGLLVSTLLTLIVVPVMYSLIDQLGSRIRKKPAESSSGTE